MNSTNVVRAVLFVSTLWVVLAGGSARAEQPVTPLTVDLDLGIAAGRVDHTSSNGIAERQTALSLDGGLIFGYALSEHVAPVLLVDAALGTNFMEVDNVFLTLTAGGGVRLMRLLPVDLTLAVGYDRLSGLPPSTSEGVALMGQVTLPTSRMVEPFVRLRADLLNNDQGALSATFGIQLKF